MKRGSSSPRGLLIVGALAALIALSVTGYGWAKDHRELNARRQVVGTLQLACRFYATDHGGAMPPDLQAVSPKYLNESYLADAMKQVDYFPGLTDANQPSSLLVQEKKADAKGRRWIGALDQELILTSPDSPAPSRIRER